MWKMKIKDYILRFTYRERRSVELAEFKKELKEYRIMHRDELEFEYVNLKAEYEHKKGVLTAFVVSLALAILMNIWKAFFSFMEQVFQYVAVITDAGNEVVGVSFRISVIVVVAVMMFVIFVLFSLARNVKEMRRRLIIIEEIRKEREKGISIQEKQEDGL